MELCCQAGRNSDGVVVKFSLTEREAWDSIPNLTTTISEIGYLLSQFDWNIAKAT